MRGNHQKQAESGSAFAYHLRARARDMLANCMDGRWLWTSKLSLNLSVIIIGSILLVQSMVAWMMLQGYEDTRYHELEENTRTAIVNVIASDQGEGALLTYDEAQQLLAKTQILGMSIYNTSLERVSEWGQIPRVSLSSSNDIYNNYEDKSRYVYDTILKPNELGVPYYIALRLDTHLALKDIHEMTRQAIVIVLLMSAFMATLLLGLIGQWFLRPIVFLTRLLDEAMQEDESASLSKEVTKFQGKTEINRAIQAAAKLIDQNERHIKDIKNRAEDRIHQLAYYDTLTDLPNRIQFLEKLDEFAKTHDKDGQFVVVAVDLDHFRDINDTMGHAIGDIVLKSVADRLKKSLPPRAVVARVGEDGFAVMLPIIKDVNTAEDIAKRVSHAIKSERYSVGNEELSIHSSVGYAIFPDDGAEPDTVLKNADLALNRAKEDGRDMIRAYSQDFDLAVQSRFQLLRDLREALENEEFELHFQPQFDLNSEKIIGAEALIRWWKPDNSKAGGMYISPGEFIPIAESSGLIVPIGDWVVREACMTAMELKAEGLDDIRVALNVSGAQFKQKDMVSKIAHTIHETGVDPKKIEVEVTESAFMADMNHTIEVLNALNELGLELAIDDFGTGYSSLAYLRQFPIDRLKIDRSFIINALNNNDDASITRTIIALGHALNLKVLAEGVETIDHQNFLKEEGCDEVQGFRYSKALPKEKFISFCKGYKNKLNSLAKPKK